MKKTLIVICSLLLAIIFFLAGVLGYGIIANNTTFGLGSHVKKAVKYMNEGNHEDAILEFNKAIAIEDRIPEIHLAKANAEIKLERYDDAKETTADALDLMESGKAKKSPVTKHLDPVLDGKEDYMSEMEVIKWWYKETEGDARYEDLRKWTEGYLEEDSKSDDKKKDTKLSYNPDEVMAAYKEVLFNDASEPDNSYSVYDIDKDGVPELILSGNVYTYSNNGVQNLGPLPYDQGYIGPQEPGLCTYPEENGIMLFGYIMTQGNSVNAMESAFRVTLENGTLVSERIYKNDVMIELGSGPIGLSLPGDIVENSTYLNTYYCGYQGSFMDEFGFLSNLYKFDNQYDAYKMLINAYWDNGRYTLYDIDKDGIKELFLSADESAGLEVFGYNNGKIVTYSGAWPGMNSTIAGKIEDLYEYEDNGIIYKSDMGDFGEIAYIEDGILWGQSSETPRGDRYNDITYIDDFSPHKKITDYCSVGDLSLLETIK